MNEAKLNISAYLSGTDKRAYFVSADDAEYVELKNYLRELSTVRVGSFCYGDGFPDWDNFFDTVKTLPHDAVILGLGEAVLLSGNYRVVNRLCAQTFSKKLVILCRGLKNFLLRLASESPRFRKNLSVVESAESFSVIQYDPNLGVKTAARNFRELLSKLEDGVTGVVEVNSELPLEKVLRISTAYEAIKLCEPGMRAPSEALTNEQWRLVLSGDKTWAKYLRGFDEKFTNEYEQFAFEQSRNADEFERNIFHVLLKLDPNSRHFAEMYRLRKSLVAASDEKYLSSYVEAVKSLGADGLNYLTDNTRLEFQAAVELAQFGNRATLEKNFPAIRRYLTDYDFSDERLTKYFHRYKELKLFNFGATEFLSEVARQSELRLYNEFDTRQSVLERIGYGALYWLDGLSADFLSYIKLRLSEINLRTKIQIARAELPTLTALNKNFYEEWPFEKFPKNERLDKLRHEARKVSVYFCDEISIIEDVLKDIYQALKNSEAKKIILTSDHGSSRGAAVYRGRSLKLNAIGEHGGRCCKIDVRDKKPKCAVESNGYYALTNYDRIIGGRLEGVEVHGGATLEEVLVPVIEIFM